MKLLGESIMAKVIHIKKDCIGCGACAAVAPEYWEMDEEGMAHLKESKQVEDNWEKEITADEVQKHKEAAQVCPVEVIKVEN